MNNDIKNDISLVACKPTHQMREIINNCVRVRTPACSSLRLECARPWGETDGRCIVHEESLRACIRPTEVRQDVINFSFCLEAISSKPAYINFHTGYSLCDLLLIIIDVLDK